MDTEQEILSLHETIGKLSNNMSNFIDASIKQQTETNSSLQRTDVMYKQTLAQVQVLQEEILSIKKHLPDL